jgi:uncharacterized protein YdaU (DUF1376 family)
VKVLADFFPSRGVGSIGVAMPKSDIWMPWYPADYLRDTITLTLEEDAVYRRALDFLWQNPNGIPKETQRLSLALRISVKQAEKYRFLLEKYLILVGDFYQSNRINIEREKAERFREKQRNNGNLGGRPRKEKTHGLFLANPTVNPNESPSYSHSHSYSNNELKPNNDRASDASAPDTHRHKNGSRFVKPTLSEIQEYCDTRGNSVDAQKFLDYYESNGWKVGRNGMKDWRAAVRTWERNSGFGGYKRSEDNGDAWAAAEIEASL